MKKMLKQEMREKSKTGSQLSQLMFPETAGLIKKKILVERFGGLSEQFLDNILTPSWPLCVNVRNHLSIEKVLV